MSCQSEALTSLAYVISQFDQGFRTTMVIQKIETYLVTFHENIVEKIFIYFILTLRVNFFISILIYSVENPI